MHRNFLALAFLTLTAITESACGGGGYYYVRTPPPPRPYAVGMVGRAPGPGYVWIDGFYDWRGSGWAWAPGYWARPPRPRAVWVPGYVRHEGRHGYRYSRGYWR